MHDPDVAAHFRSATAPLWRPSDALARGSALPGAPGLYAWYFDALPALVPTAGCVRIDGFTLAYVGIAPSIERSTQTLRRRLRSHAYKDASRSTVRLTIGALLGLPPHRTPSDRVTFGTAEATLTDWLETHARVRWVATPEPWRHEADVIARLSLPLNLQHNERHPFHATLGALRRGVRAGAFGTDG